MNAVLFLTRGSVIAADAIVLVLTWVKSFKHLKEMGRPKLGSPILVVLLRDGMHAGFACLYTKRLIKFRPRHTLFWVGPKEFRDHVPISLNAQSLSALLAVNILQLITYSSGAPQVSH